MRFSDMTPEEREYMQQLYDEDKYWLEKHGKFPEISQQPIGEHQGLWFCSVSPMMYLWHDGELHDGCFGEEDENDLDCEKGYWKSEEEVRAAYDYYVSYNKE